MAKEESFALHGGTAINLFVRDMPRLSVDIDLTYVPIEDRSATLLNVSQALERIKNRIEYSMPGSQIRHRSELGKLFLRAKGVEIKLEVNLIGRGTLGQPVRMSLCEKAQAEYDVFISMPVVPFGQLFGGKICAALDRQHPRDVFDVKLLLANEGFSDHVRAGFLLCLLGSDKALSELLLPRLKDQRQAMENQFLGMTDTQFTYEDFEQTREALVGIVHESLSDADKEFLLSFKSCSPDWSIYDFERFPAVQWKLQNLRNLRASNPAKHEELYQALKSALA